MEEAEEKLICFVIDDDPDDLESFKLAIDAVNQDITCITANSGEEGLRLLDALESPPQYIFLDLNMPSMNGWECLHEIKSRDRLRQVPIIILSTAQSLKTLQELRQLEIARYIVKPDNLNDLSKAIARVFVREVIL